MTGRGVEDVWRDAVPHVLAALVRRYGDFDAAEDAVQEALIAAARTWPVDGWPDNPRGWLITTASRRLVDAWRADSARTSRELAVTLREPPDDVTSAGPAVAPQRDDSLTLLVLCCHPVIPRPSQVALTLRAVGGLTTAQIARGFLVPEATMAQRISRAKARLRRLDTPFATPSQEELPGRVRAVTQVLYLIFTEGHTATGGSTLTDTTLAAEAIRLARGLHERLPADTEVAGLLALMLLTDARRGARLDGDGALVPLAEQDRRRWDRAAIVEGIRLVEAALPHGPVGPYQLQAAIAAVHAEAVEAPDTDWAQVETLYRMLLELTPDPMVRLSHAVAVAEVDGPLAGLTLVGPLADDPQLRRNHRLYAVRAHLLDRAGRAAEARADFATAARLATSVPEQRYLSARADPSAGWRPLSDGPSR